MYVGYIQALLHMSCASWNVTTNDDAQPYNYKHVHLTCSSCCKWIMADRWTDTLRQIHFNKPRLSVKKFSSIILATASYIIMILIMIYIYMLAAVGLPPGRSSTVQYSTSTSTVPVPVHYQYQYSTVPVQYSTVQYKYQYSTSTSTVQYSTSTSTVQYTVTHKQYTEQHNWHKQYT